MSDDERKLALNVKGSTVQFELFLDLFLAIILKTKPALIRQYCFARQKVCSANQFICDL